MRDRRVYGTAALVGVLLLLGVRGAGQTQRNPATLDDVLTELQGMRADLLRSSTAGVRAQLLTARLSLEEQRLADLGRQLASEQLRLDEASAKRRELEQGLKDWEAALSTNALPPEQHRDIEASMPRRRAEVTQIATDEQELRTKVSGLSNQILSEQGLWTEFSNRLDELERSLSQK